jgi:hypothetical protein
MIEQKHQRVMVYDIVMNNVFCLYTEVFNVIIVVLAN